MFAQALSRLQRRAARPPLLSSLALASLALLLSSCGSLDRLGSMAGSATETIGNTLNSVGEQVDTITALTGEPVYAASERERKRAEKQAIIDAQEAEEAAQEKLRDEQSRLAASDLPLYEGSPVSPLRVEAQTNPAFVNNRVRLRIQSGGQQREIVIELDPDGAPDNVANFKNNVQTSFYEGMLVHRLVPNFLIQMGDPLTRDPSQKSDWGTGGPNYTVKFEQNGTFTKGTVGIGRLRSTVNPDLANNGSQFFIALGELPELNGQFTAIGKVVEGLDVLEALAKNPTDENDVPLEPLTLADADLVTGGPLGTSLMTWEKNSLPEIKRISGTGSAALSRRARRVNRLVGPPEPGTMRGIINRLW